MKDISISKKNKIRKTRSHGLKKYDLVLSKISENEIIDKSIIMYNDNYKTYFDNLSDYFKEKYGTDQEWYYFHYKCFLTIVRDVLLSIDKRKYLETSISFNLDEAITNDKLVYIANKCNINQSYIDIYPRN